MSSLLNFIYLKILKINIQSGFPKSEVKVKTRMQIINVSAGSWHSQWVQISIRTPRRTAYLRSPEEWFSAAVYFGLERASACWVWVVVGWLVSAMWLLWIPSLAWNSPPPGLVHGMAHSVHSGGRPCSPIRLSSALCPVSCQMCPPCILPSSQAPTLMFLKELSISK